MNKFEKQLDEIFKRYEAVGKIATAESRNMTQEELDRRSGLKLEIEAVKRAWDDFKAEEELRSELYGNGSGAQTTFPDTAVTSQPDAPIYRGSPASMLGQQCLDIRTLLKPNMDNGEVRAARSRLDQVEKRSIVLAEKQLRSENRALSGTGMTVGVPTEGGFFLQGETAIELMTNGFNNSAILPLTDKRTLNAATQFVEIIGIDETSRVTGSRGGGIRVYTNKELGAFTASKTVTKKIRIEPQKLTGLYQMSGEMTRNVTFMGQELRRLFGEEFSFKWQDLCYRGSGAGEGLGAINSPCLITVAKETGQAAKTILTENLSKMWSRFDGRNPVWVINRDTNPQLDMLSIAVGTGALEPRFVTYDSQGILRIKGAPVIAIEQCETLGTVGDIMLVDWSDMITADKGGLLEDSSIHVDFLNDQETFRFIHYFDCQFRHSSAITPYKGSATIGPVVVLATRA